MRRILKGDLGLCSGAHTQAVVRRARVLIVVLLLIACQVQGEAARAPSCFGPLDLLCGASSRCERGHYCVNGFMLPCPAGRFGSSSEETGRLCSGPCPEGFFCPGGTSSPIACGTSAVFCPAGSVAPIPASPGKYTLGGASPAERTTDTICPKGRYCREGISVVRPSGTYGELEGLREEACSGPCLPGWYCPPGTVNPFSFMCGGPQHYCPEGSKRPIPVDRGFYAAGLSFDRAGEAGGFSIQKRCPIGQYCLDGMSLPCPPGRFGASQLSTNPSCTGVCREGHFCPEGSYRADQHVCGNASVYCPEGSSTPTAVSEGFYTVQGNGRSLDRHPWLGVAESRTTQVRCEPGFYCVEGVRRTCPPGFYGNTSGLSTPYCSGPCAAGYVCGVGATTPTEAECGGAGELFCPEGSSMPRTVSEGYYTLGGLVTADELMVTAIKTADKRGGDTALTTPPMAEALCEPGFWCVGGIRYPCDAGSFGDAFGLTVRNCSGPCNPGYLCGNGSVSSEERPCGDTTVYCPGGNWEPLAVSEGHYSVGGHGPNIRTGQVPAPPGRYANLGLLFTCPPGRYGASYGLSSIFCSGDCSPGFYCPAGSVSRRERACGGASMICPAGSGAPIAVDDGYYTTDFSTVPDEEPCPPGHFRNSSFPFDKDPTRDGPSAIATAIPLPPCQLCPDGTFKANTGDDLSLCLPCDEHTAESIVARTSCVCRRISGGAVTAQLFYFNATSAACENVTANFKPPAEAVLVESTFTRYTQRECEPGHFCDRGVRFPCPAGSFGSAARETRSECEGDCTAGWYCPEGSVSANQVPCGAENLYCPTASAAPIFVDAGFYTIGDYNAVDAYNTNAIIAASSFEDTVGHNARARTPDDSRGVAYRSGVALCPAGWYCTGDGGGAKCPPGSYGSEVGLSDPACSGTCSGGHFCPSGSTSPFQQKCGQVGLYCPVGASAPLNVSKGYYGIHAGPMGDLQAVRDPLNETHSAQILCEPGYFCEGGLKEPCLAGKFQWQYGESSPDACMPCKAGYYCPGQTGSPSITATRVECGHPALFCPTGSVEPKTVGAGFYSVGGSLNGTTRVSQVICEPGHYCNKGMKSLCPQGTFGTSSGLHDQRCSGPCPAGATCPKGTSIPIPCEEGFYAIGGAVVCTACPGRRVAGVAGERCRHSRNCCT